MHLIEIFLPLRDNMGNRFSPERYTQVRRELTDEFGGVTAFLRAPALGLWVSDKGRKQQDELVILEVMTELLDASWWRDYRQRLQDRFRQSEVLIRASVVDTL